MFFKEKKKEKKPYIQLKIFKGDIEEVTDDFNNFMEEIIDNKDIISYKSNNEDSWHKEMIIWVKYYRYK